MLYEQGADDVVASKQPHCGPHGNGPLLTASDPRGESTPRVRRSTAALGFGVLGFVGMDYSVSRQEQQGVQYCADTSASKQAEP